MEERIVEIIPDPDCGHCDFGAVGEEIIRCRDCKHFRDVPMADGSTGHRCSGVFTFVEPRPDGFCAWAERDE